MVIVESPVRTLAKVDATGLWYPSLMYAGHPCVARYERAEHALPPRPNLHLALADPPSICRCSTWRRISMIGWLAGASDLMRTRWLAAAAQVAVVAFAEALYPLR